MDLLKVRRQLEAGKTIFDLELKVVYYARVSTDRDEQLNSLENQIKYYDEYIKSNRNWTFTGGYIDEGISGTSVNKRDNFLKMIADAENDMFDLIVTKEISRFSRSTLDSIKYTQELLEHGVGVYFQSDNINTLYSDSELRLTIMSSIAQDEMRRLSERVKFGVKRAYESGKVLGNDSIYGYNKANGKLEINEEEAKFVRELFYLYADDKYGYRTITKILTSKGYLSQGGKELNPGTLKGIITNPKYKGYYHGRLTESNDYRYKKNIKLSDEEKLLYKDDNVPAIVNEDIWNRANRILKERAEKFKQRSTGTQKHFPYSGKIICEEHGTYYYRKLWKDRKIPTEGWCCKEYLAKGRQACSSPSIYTRELDSIMNYIGEELLSDKNKHILSINNLISLYEKAGNGNVDFSKEIVKITKEIDKIVIKKEKLLDLYTDEEMEKTDYLSSNSNLCEKERKLKEKIKRIKDDEKKSTDIVLILKNTRTFLENITNSDLKPLEIAQEMLQKVIVCKESTKGKIKLKIKMNYGDVVPTTIIKTFLSYSTKEVAPIVGSERQSEELVNYLLSEFENDPQKIWESNIFGKSLHELVNEGLQNKLAKMPEDAQQKIQETLERIINEGSGGLICIIL
ncbi:MAG: recombinase family protein [Oscillospiraceae bacterium]|nr:recombinase family protein [Oscillospiraceae bacterium]